MRLIQWLIWRWLDAYNVDESMLDGIELAIEEEAARLKAAA
jgi:hypothetical protein